MASALTPTTSISAPTVTQCHHRQRLGSCAFSKCRKTYTIAIFRDNVLGWSDLLLCFLQSVMAAKGGRISAISFAFNLWAFLLVFLPEAHSLSPRMLKNGISQTQGISAENQIFRQVRVHHHSAYRRCSLDIICSLDSVCSFFSQQLSQYFINSSWEREVPSQERTSQRGEWECESDVFHSSGNIQIWNTSDLSESAQIFQPNNPTIPVEILCPPSPLLLFSVVYTSPESVPNLALPLV